MKVIHWLSIITANLVFIGWGTAFAEPNDINSLKYSGSSAAHPEEDSTYSKLSGRGVYERISNETDGVYLFKLNPSTKDYSKFLNNVFEKPLNEDDAARKIDSP